MANTKEINGYNYNNKEKIILNKELTILMIEDNPGDIRLIKEMLSERRQRKSEIVESYTLENGINLLKQMKFDAILLDLSLPDSYGLESLQLIQENHFDQPIIILTSIDDEELAIKAVQMGAQDYVVKGSVNSILLERFIIHSIERHHIEKNLKKSKKKLQKELNKVELLKDILSHDINNIFQNILCASEIIKKVAKLKENKIDISNYLKIIEDTIQKGAKLIDNIKIISQINDEKLFRKKVNISMILKKIFGEIKNEFKTKDIAFNIKIKKDYVTLNIDKYFNKIFYNIIKNAIIHNNNKKIVIDIISHEIHNENSSNLKLEFTDNGIGICNHRKKKIFLRGFAGDENIYETGLGLSLVKKIIGKYDGEIWIEDRVPGDHSQGSKFMILFPEV